MSDQTPAEGRFPGDPASDSRSGAGTSENGGAPPPPLHSEGHSGPSSRSEGHSGPAPVSEGHSGPDIGAGTARNIPDATVARLPVYLRCLVEMAETKTVTASSERLAEMAGVNAAKVRKDLSYLGSYGTRGVGYEVDNLIVQISRILGLTQDWPVVIVGIGNLGHALANYRGFAARGFRVAALVDADRAKVGDRVDGMVVRHIDELPRIAADERVAIGIIATPAAAAQDVADRLVAAGVSSILNFAPAIVTVPTGVSVRKVDLSIELQILSYHQQRRGSAATAAAVSDSDPLVLPSGEDEAGPPAFDAAGVADA